MTFTETFTVEALAPFNFDLTAQVFGSGDSQIRTYKNGQLTQMFRVNDKLVLAKLKSSGTVEKPEVKVTLQSNISLTVQDKQKTREDVKFIFNLDFDLCFFYQEIKNDSTMHQITQQLHGLKNPTTPTVFEALVDSIVEQQISIKVAHTLEEKLVKNFGETLTIGNETYYAYPTPRNISGASVEEVQGCGLSWRTAEYTHGAAKLIVDCILDLEGLKTKESAEEIVSELDVVRGTEVWTAELTMLRGMQRLGALPADDLGVRRVISRYYCGGRAIKGSEAREIAKRWGTWKGLAAFYLIIAGVRDIKV
jgi:DNA-3-methyladenine glycosylase II